MSTDVGVRTLILLHGHDDDPATARTVAPTLAPPGWNIEVPEGPAVTGERRRAWWRSDDDGAPFADDVDDAVVIVREAVARLAASGPVVLAGFSQGGALALALAVGAQRITDAAWPVAGVVAIGAWLPDLVAIPADLPGAARRGTPVLIAHGNDDDAVPLLLGRSAARLLERHDVPVTLTTLDVGHQVEPFAPPVVAWLAALAP